MKFSYNWISEFVEGLELTPHDLERLLTMKTAECEGIAELTGERHLKSDFIIEIDNKSITHRPDLWGHYGMAREVAAISRLPLRDPVKPDLLPSGAANINVAIEDFSSCPRYSALVFENVAVAPSPRWLQYRLESIGLNSIDNIVDFTNLVMAELGQPTHAFDRDLLSGDTIFIRPARYGERILALNDEEYALGESNLVIADAAGPVAIAGVIGGRASAIHAGTKSIVLESACFQAASVRRTSALLKLRTDASMRFEKSQDPANTVRALARAVELLAGLSPGIRLAGGLADQQGNTPEPPRILMPLDWIARKLGREASSVEIRQILQNLGFQVSEPVVGTLAVRVPSWRATKDISVKEDLVEEIGRMIGYDSIHPAPPSVLIEVPFDNPEREFHRWLRMQMAAQGFTEVYNYSFVNEAQLRAFGFNPADHLAVTNPIASDQNLLRRSLLPGIARNIAENSKYFDAFRLFEIGCEIHPQAEGLPDEIPHLSAAIFSRDDGVKGMLEIKRAAECLLPEAEVSPCLARPYEHPERAAAIHWRGAEVGRIFEMHPALIEGRAAILDLDLRAILVLRPRGKRYTPPRRYPSSAFDLSVIADGREQVGELQKKITSLVPRDALEGVRYIGQYAGPPFSEGRKSVSFRLTVGSAEKTLSSEEVGAIRAAVIEGMRSLGYELRV